MQNPIDRHEVQRLLDEQHAQLVEVLPEAEFEDEHLPGAINVPLKTLDRERARQLDRARPVIVCGRGVALGGLGGRAIRERATLAAEEVMTPGPSTVRPSARLQAMIERMRRQKLTNPPVTTSDGRLAGLLTLRAAGRRPTP